MDKETRSMLRFIDKELKKLPFIRATAKEKEQIKQEMLFWNLCQSSYDADLTRAILKRGFHVNEIHDSNTLLHCASNSCAGFDAMKVLVEEGGADVNLPNAGGNTALMFAARGLWIDRVEYLLQQGAAINWKNDKGETALVWTVRDGCAADAVAHIQVVERLITAGADVSQISGTWKDDLRKKYADREIAMSKKTAIRPSGRNSP